MVAVDDVQKLDAESLRILIFVMRRLHGKRILFLLTLNPAEARRVPAGVLDFLTGHQVARIPLDPLIAAAGPGSSPGVCSASI